MSGWIGDHTVALLIFILGEMDGGSSHLGKDLDQSSARCPPDAPLTHKDMVRPVPCVSVMISIGRRGGSRWEGLWREAGGHP